MLKGSSLKESEEASEEEEEFERAESYFPAYYIIQIYVRTKADYSSVLERGVNTHP